MRFQEIHAKFNSYNKRRGPKKVLQGLIFKGNFEVLRKMSSLEHLVIGKLGKMTSPKTKAMFSFKEKIFKITLFEILKANLKFKKGSSW
jgi:hypothetical protein